MRKRRAQEEEEEEIDRSKREYLWPPFVMKWKCASTQIDRSKCEYIQYVIFVTAFCHGKEMCQHKILWMLSQSREV